MINISNTQTIIMRPSSNNNNENIQLSLGSPNEGSDITLQNGGIFICVGELSGSGCIQLTNSSITIGSGSGKILSNANSITLGNVKITPTTFTCGALSVMLA